MRRLLFRLSDAALDLIAPKTCLACGGGRQARVGLCVRCAALVRPLPTEPCRRCAGRLGPGADESSCRTCAALRPKFAAAVAAGPYAGFLGELIRRAKYGRDPLLAVPLAELLVEAVVSWPDGEGVSLVVPVPGTRARVRERGFHLADLVAERVADALGARFRDDRLARVGEPVPQASLPRTKRRTAARGTVEVRTSRWRKGAACVEGETVLLVDDVLTTGATANECARVLLAAGADEVRVAVCARA